MINFIKEGNIVWYGCDQDFGKRYSVFAPFFGIDAATLTTPAWIARETGASVIFLSQFREGNGVYSIYFSEIFENYPEEDEVANATRLNQEIEKGRPAPPRAVPLGSPPFQDAAPGRAEPLPAQEKETEETEAESQSTKFQRRSLT